MAYPKSVELIPLREPGRDAVLVIVRLFVLVVETRCVVFLPTSWITKPRISSTTSPRITRAMTEGEKKGFDIIFFYLFRSGYKRESYIVLALHDEPNRLRC